MAIDDDTLVVGATRWNADSPPSAAYVFTRVNGNWTLRSTLESNADPEPISFGAAVALASVALLVAFLAAVIVPAAGAGA